MLHLMWSENAFKFQGADYFGDLSLFHLTKQPLWTPRLGFQASSLPDKLQHVHWGGGVVQPLLRAKMVELSPALLLLG